MSPVVGQQLYGPRRLALMLRMGRHPVLGRMSLRQKAAVFMASRESKLTRVGDEIYSNTFTPVWPSLAYDRFLEGLESVGHGLPRPIVANFALTARCICRCWHCSFSNRDATDSLDLPALRRAIGELQDLGTAVIGFTGGEPLLRDDLEEIIAAVGPRSTPLLFTTGYGLTRERVRALKDAGLKMPVVSLDHHTAARHDAGRGVPGAYDRALAAIRLFQQAGLYTSISFVPTRALLDDPEDFWRCLSFFRELGVNDMRLTSPILSGKLTHRPEEALDDRHRALIFQAQQTLTRTPGHPGVFAYDWFESERVYGCGAGFNYLFVDSMGNVCPCDFTMMSWGNLREQPLAEIWEQMSKRFSRPGLSCYATRIAAQVAQEENTTWPLDREASCRVHTAVPSHGARLPAFYRRMGLKAGLK